MAACTVVAGAVAYGRGRRPTPATELTIAPNGSVRVILGGRDLGTLQPGLFEEGWRGATIGAARPGAQSGERLGGQIHAPGGAIVDVETRVTKSGAGVEMAYRLVPRDAIRLNSLHIALSVPASTLLGGAYSVGAETHRFPTQLGSVQLHSGPCETVSLRTAAGHRLNLRFPRPTPVLVQDDRQWGPTFTVRIGPQLDGGEAWPAGKPLDIALVVTSDSAVTLEYDGPHQVTAGADWLPLETKLDIVPGSALDLSKAFAWHAPAGVLGRVTVDRQGAMVFERRPTQPVRFYGINLCFSAQYLDHAAADRLAVRLRQIGYNAVRIHHYESLLVDRSAEPNVRLLPDALDRLDYLFAAMKRNGIYVTTDLFVSRPVPASVVWEGADGDVGMDEFKMAVPVNANAYRNYCAFARALLAHRNPYTRTRWADDPALAWLSLINEGSPGNFLQLLQGRLRDDWQRAWDRWTADHPVAGSGAPVPMPASDDRSQTWRRYVDFLAENQIDFVRRSRAFLRDEIGCRALLTNNNAWTNPIQMQAVRQDLDYVDDHFYVDHPEFIENAWQLPSRCPNTSPVAQGAPGGRPGAFLRRFDAPYTCTEFNYAGPGRYRGVGGIITGALGAVQDWSGIWRFAYSHDRGNLFAPAPAGYFDLVSDPLSQAADRASLFLFRRGDMRPAPHAVVIALPKDRLIDPATPARSTAPGWDWLALVTRVGTAQRATSGAARLVVPLETREASSAAPTAYAPDSGARILAELRRRGWIRHDNPTDPAQPRFQSETGELTVDGPADMLRLDTPRTAGGYAPAGATIRTRDAALTVRDVGATVWISSLDARPIRESRRLLVTHLTDLQNTQARYGDRARQVLLDWGRLPHLVRRGRASLAVRVRDLARARVWGLGTDGARLGRVQTRAAGGRLIVPLDTDAAGRARILYEIEIPGR